MSPAAAAAATTLAHNVNIVVFTIHEGNHPQHSLGEVDNLIGYRRTHTWISILYLF